MCIFGLNLMQGCIKEYPADRKKIESAEWRIIGSAAESACGRQEASINASRASARALESRVKRLRIL